MSASSAPVPDLSLNKILAGSGAAVTSAVIGSFFGVAGTIVGAALGSAASTVAAALYERSLERTRATILLRLHAGSEGSGEPGGSADDGGDETDPGDETAGAPPHRPTPHLRRWVGLAGGTVLVFLLGMLAVTGVEWVKGSTVAGPPGTSVERVIGPGPAGPAVPVATTAEPTRTAEPSTSSSPSATSEASDSSAQSSSPSAGPSTAPSTTKAIAPSGKATPATPTSGAADSAAPATRPG